MNIKIQTKNYELSKTENEAIEKKLSQSLKKYKTNNEDPTVSVKITGMRSKTKAEVAMSYMNYKINSEHETTDTALSAIDRCIAVLERQVEKYKTRIHKSRYSGQNIRTAEINIEVVGNEEEDTGASKIVKVENYQMKPMGVEEAILQMELMEFKFYVFYNNATNSTCVVYQRDDGNIGLIEPEMT